MLNDLCEVQQVFPYFFNDCKRLYGNDINYDFDTKNQRLFIYRKKETKTETAVYTVVKEKDDYFLEFRTKF